VFTVGLLGYSDVNLALHKPATHQQTYHSFVAHKAVDGRLDTYSRTYDNIHPWWTVDLRQAYYISHVTVITDFTDNQFAECKYRSTYLTYLLKVKSNIT